ncbi:alpha/beta-hydrolase [Tilletiopsis washingtonensis]|uniref:Alpha/beta-hydrolase n=1 Tax=Tilletiopsis washingtonensis TaxID=58919 RepID=A0A316Z7M2_9BASI|nr:alpha/beta-hydrolase [Tilletiopsis washingtonensis]PWN97770.1 alpha/beta-hydrolase [Tilletiopsis washingtonensis]
MAPATPQQSTEKAQSAAPAHHAAPVVPHSAPKVDPAVALAVRRAKPPRAKFWRPLLRMVIFHIYFLPLTVGVALPALILKNLLPFMRTHPQWSFLQALSVSVVRWAMHNFIALRLQPIAPREGGWRESPNFLAALLVTLNLSGPGGFAAVRRPQKVVKAAKKQTHGHDRVWMDAPPLEYFRGLLTIHSGSSSAMVRSPTYTGPPLVDPSWAKARTRAFWFMRKAGEAPPELDGSKRDRPVILYFHGGAGVTFAAGDIFMGQTLARNLASTTGIDVFSVDYALAPHGAFPIPVTQALAAWLHLQSMGYAPDQIFLGGDSFGSHLSLALERYLRLEMPALHGEGHSQKPLGMILLSPWVSAVDQHWPSREDNIKYDIITRSFPIWGLDAMRVGPKHKHRNGTLANLENPWISPVNQPKEEYAQHCPAFVANGALECLLDEGKEFVKRSRSAGAAVEYVCVALEPHDFFTMSTSVQASRGVYRKIGTWARKLLDNRPYELA